ncbi:MAG: FAD-dependent oxidoreductase [Candidatus Omnitrophota bacterium]|jgi:protoporphyrinogen oxidase|nr:MAG: FAD-dependent oxidoreductase [Candidatus Omnitrophota bacterium]
MTKQIVILGAGITGLTTAWKLVQADADLDVTVIEREPIPGGLAKSIDWKGYHLDLGPHRFHTEIQEIRDFVHSFCEEKMARVKRRSRMYLNGCYIPYPISPLQTLKSLGIRSTATFLLSAVKILFEKHDAIAPSYEEYVQRYYGNALYQTIFKPFAQKVWGVEASQISEETARVRLRGENIWHALKDSLLAREETYVSEFLYPRGGIGEIARKFSQEIISRGGHIAIGKNVDAVQVDHGQIKHIQTSGMGGEREYPCDYLVNTIPLPTFTNLISPSAPDEILDASRRLHFRALVLVYLLFYHDFGIQDTWLYYPEKHVPFSRIYVPDNFANTRENQGKTCLCLEFPCETGDKIWTAQIEDLATPAVRILRESGLIDTEPVDALAVRIEEGYPLYAVGYEQSLKAIVNWLNTTKNCLTVGRQGLFRHNNIDQGMQMGLLAAEEIIKQPNDFSDWYKNVDQFNEYRIVD